MRCLAYNYPDMPSNNIKKSYERFYHELFNFLVCSICSAKIEKYNKEKPIENYLCCNDCVNKWLIGCYSNCKISKANKIIYKRKELYTNPKNWGSHFWHIMEKKALQYSKRPTLEQKRDVIIFYKDIVNLLPCQMCSDHYNDVIKTYWIDDYVCCQKCLYFWFQLVQKKTKNNKLKITHVRQPKLYKH